MGATQINTTGMADIYMVSTQHLEGNVAFRGIWQSAVGRLNERITTAENNLHQES